MNKIAFSKSNVLMIVKGIFVTFIFMAITLAVFIGYRNFINNDLKDNIKVISCSKAYELWEFDRAIFIDARDEYFYKYMHIRKSISIPYTKRKYWNKISISSSNKDTILIVYCDSYICSLNDQLAKYLSSVGFTNVMTLEGGLDEWNEENYPVER